ncbi:efflux transporter outer membrane subunit [Pararhodonellum marinum]|uniref:efflux transporter outer membrane subunit n=1 Tax=Pararhodonellum marinum TaxID=2755358 RepID=UPI00188EE0F5|nr:efflux transporter outer membrane subunit [Pararhodonellum marinum]
MIAKIKNKLPICVLSIWVFAVACQVPKNTLIQASEIPLEFEQSQIPSQPSAALLNWDMFFEDENLKKLVRIGLDKNQDNLKALQSINLARAQLSMAKGGLLPTVSGIAGASTRKFGEYTMDGIGNADSNLSPTVPEDKKIPDPYRDFFIGADFQWEIDVWGKLRNRKLAAAKRYLASEEMANNIKTWLIAEIAMGYYQLIGLDEELRILNDNIRLQELAVNLSKDLKFSGKETQLAVDQFEALMLNSKALAVEKKREIRTIELYLSTLLGTFVDEIQRLKMEEAFQDPELLELGLPSDLLIYRPDIRMAEQNLLATSADINAARAAFFPSFNLMGMAGFNAFDFSRLFLTPGSTVYQIGAGLMAPVFHRNQIRAEFEGAKASQKIALLDYEQTVLKSYLEILQWVNDFKMYDEQLQLKIYEVEVQKRSVDNSNTLFSVGYANYLEVLNAQSRALQAEIELVEIKTNQLQSQVKLYRALGGGWIEKGEG